MTDISQIFGPTNYNSFIAGDQPLKTRKVTVVAGAVYPAGTVLGHITATDSYTIATVAATDGSQTPAAILATDIDTTSGASVTSAYFEGEFADRLLNYGTGHTSATVDASFRTSGSQIYIRTLPIIG